MLMLRRERRRLLLVVEEWPRRFAIGLLRLDRNEFQLRIAKRRQRPTKDAAGVDVDRLVQCLNGKYPVGKLDAVRSAEVPFPTAQ